MSSARLSQHERSHRTRNLITAPQSSQPVGTAGLLWWHEPPAKEQPARKEPQQQRRARELRRAGLLADEDHGLLVGAILATADFSGKREDGAVRESGGVLRPEARRHDRPEVPDRDRH